MDIINTCDVILIVMLVTFSIIVFALMKLWNATIKTMFILADKLEKEREKNLNKKLVKLQYKQRRNCDI